MKFRTEMDIHPSESPLKHKDNILFMGSCFAQEMGARFEKLLWPSLTNPLGICYHPLALFRHLDWIIEGKAKLTTPWFEVEGRQRNFDLHSSMSRSTLAETEQHLRDQIDISHTALKSAQALVITLGTSWIYRLKENGRWVNNNHKQAASQFDLEISSVDEIIEEGRATLTRCRQLNPTLKFIFTVSPIRHIRHGLVENNRSKSILIQAVHSWCDQVEDAHYFPSYEIMMDDLRDYRFYAEDMIHPSASALDYIFEKFERAWVSESDQEVLEEIKAILKFESHQPFNANAEAHQIANRKYQKRKSDLFYKYPYLKARRWKVPK